MEEKEVCEICGRTFSGIMAAKEKFIHQKYFHRILGGQGVCPECGASVRHQEGCEFCVSCGWSRCG